MPRTIDEGFRDFLYNLTPSSYESDAAKKHRASLHAWWDLLYNYMFPPYYR